MKWERQTGLCCHVVSRIWSPVRRCGVRRSGSQVAHAEMIVSLDSPEPESLSPTREEGPSHDHECTVPID
jgi:hypothetical protein